MKDTDTVWNAPEHLPPVGCPLLIKVPYDEKKLVVRTSYIADKNREMEYEEIGSGEKLTGKYPWNYP